MNIHPRVIRLSQTYLTKDMQTTHLATARMHFSRKRNNVRNTNELSTALHVAMNATSTRANPPRQPKMLIQDNISIRMENKEGLKPPIRSLEETKLYNWSLLFGPEILLQPFFWDQNVARWSVVNSLIRCIRKTQRLSRHKESQVYQ